MEKFDFEQSDYISEIKKEKPIPEIKVQTQKKVYSRDLYYNKRDYSYDEQRDEPRFITGNIFIGVIILFFFFYVGVMSYMYFSKRNDWYSKQILNERSIVKQKQEIYNKDLQATLGETKKEYDIKMSAMQTEAKLKEKTLKEGKESLTELEILKIKLKNISAERDVYREKAVLINGELNKLSVKLNEFKNQRDDLKESQGEVFNIIFSKSEIQMPKKVQQPELQWQTKLVQTPKNNNKLFQAKKLLDEGKIDSAQKIYESLAGKQ